MMRAPLLVCALTSSFTLASGVALAQEPTPTPGSSSGWFDPAESKKPSDSKPTPETSAVPDAAPEEAAPPKAPEAAPPAATKAPAGSRDPAARKAPDGFEAPRSWPPPPSRPRTALVMGAGLGWVSGRFTHPDLVGTGFSGVQTNLHAGVSLSPSVTLGVDFQAYRTSLEYVGNGKYGYANADNRYVSPPPSGGTRLTAATSGDDAGGGSPFHAGPTNVLTLGPRLQFQGDPAQGLYGVVTGGVTFLEGVLTNQTGTSFGARGGYKIGLTRAVGLALELGGTAHRFEKSTALFGFGGLQLQLRLLARCV